MKKENYRIAVIGAGKLAWSLIPAIQRSGYRIDYLSSRTIESAAAASKKFKIKNYSNSLRDIPDSCNIFLLCVPDDKLGSVSASLAKTLTILKNKIFIHFSGVLGSSVLKRLSDKGGGAASFHIMQTFPSGKKVKIRNAYASVETRNRAADKFLSVLSEDLGVKSFKLNESHKTLYHLAGVFASNFMVSNLFAAEKLFSKDVKKVDFNKLIKPMLLTTIENVVNQKAVNAISGPAERGDLTTIKLHVDKLREEDPFILLSYLTQSLNIIEIKKEQGEFTSAHSEIEDYLMGRLKSYLKRSIIK